VAVPKNRKAPGGSVKNTMRVPQELVDVFAPKKAKCREVDHPPLPHVRMAWPFKTEEELRILSKWFTQQEKELKRKIIGDHVAAYGKSFL